MGSREDPREGPARRPRAPQDRIVRGRSVRQGCALTDLVREADLEARRILIRTVAEPSPSHELDVRVPSVARLFQAGIDVDGLHACADQVERADLGRQAVTLDRDLGSMDRGLSPLADTGDGDLARVT